MLVHVEGKDSENVVSALVRQVKRLPDGLMSSLTWDRGTELAHHKRFTVATDVNVYFCDPQSPWQRGSNENTNGLLRQYFPKGADLSAYSQADLDAVALRLNTRPRNPLVLHLPDTPRRREGSLDLAVGLYQSGGSDIGSRPAKLGELTTRDFGTGTRGFAASEDANLAVWVLPGTEWSPHSFAQ